MTHVPFDFVHLSDSHVLAGKADWHARITAVLDAIALLTPAPAFVLHTGDLMEEPSPKCAQAFRDLFARCPYPLHGLPGNHDVWNAPVSGADLPWWTRPTGAGDEQRYSSWFGPAAISFMHEGCAFVTLNTQSLNTALPEAAVQWTWLEGELARLAALHPPHLIVCGHMPLCIRSVDERLNLDDWRQPYMVVAPPARKRLLDLLRRHHVSAYLSGHLHYPLDYTHTWPEGHSTRFITVDACGRASDMAEQTFALPPHPGSAGFNVYRVEQSNLIRRTSA